MGEVIPFGIFWVDTIQAGANYICVRNLLWIIAIFDVIFQDNVPIS